ncbi:MAG: dihydroorotate dehydrogenase electron transfer subunit [Clostridia bacterium]|nr:dihydroorotate dehydrogenase electron transfer subunit [Clostridia bacterium]
MISTKATVVSNAHLSCGIYKLVLSIPDMPEISCGQFAMVSCGNADGILLKRPISIHDFDNKTVTLLYEAAGKGTKALSQMQESVDLDIILPLGQGFEIKNYKRIALVGGGLGVFPLFSVIRQHADVEYSAYLGARDSSHLVCADSFIGRCARVRLATDDGSAGEKTYVTSLFKEDLARYGFDAIFACGPKPMLKALKAITKDTDIPVFVSMEERMGCGFGACLTCTCKTSSGNKRVCADGPVFDINEVIL